MIEAFNDFKEEKKCSIVPVVAMSHHDREGQKWFYEAVVDCSNERRQILSIPKSRKPSLENVFL